MLTKINVTQIIKDHVETLRNYNSLKLSHSDFFVFFILPALISFSLLYYKICISNEARNILFTALSVFTALLFNLLLLVFDIIQKKEENNGTITKLKFLKEIYSNISFSILLSIVDIIVLAFTFFNNDYIYYAANFLNYYILTLFILTILMILKRVHLLLSKEISN